MSVPVRNPFNSEAMARRYACGRPYYHPAALHIAMKRLGISQVDLAVDVGCGTGLSTRALRDWAQRIVAFDVALPMVSAAEPHPRTLFVVARAERIPLPDETADLATVAAAFHWFDQPRAFAELARILRGGAGLIVYSDFFLGRLAGRSDFADWFKGVYLPRYPTPVRHAHFDPDAARAAGFDAVMEAEGETSIPLTRRQLADFLLSQSNAAIAIESGTIDAQDLHAAVVNELAPFFADDSPMPGAFGLKVWITVRVRGPFRSPHAPRRSLVSPPSSG